MAVYKFCEEEENEETWMGNKIGTAPVTKGLILDASLCYTEDESHSVLSAHK